MTRPWSPLLRPILDESTRPTRESIRGRAGRGARARRVAIAFLVTEEPITSQRTSITHKKYVVAARLATTTRHSRRAQLCPRARPRVAPANAVAVTHRQAIIMPVLGVNTSRIKTHSLPNETTTIHDETL